MEQKVSRLFDLQRFQRSSKLSAVIADVESRYAKALSDDALELVSAAGETARRAEEDQTAGMVNANMVLEGEVP